MKRLLAELAQLWSVLLRQVFVGPHQCDDCGHTCTTVPRSAYDRWLFSHYHAPIPRLECRCGGILRKVGLDSTPTSSPSERS